MVLHITLLTLSFLKLRFLKYDNFHLTYGRLTITVQYSYTQSRLNKNNCLMLTANRPCHYSLLYSEEACLHRQILSNTCCCRNNFIIKVEIFALLSTRPPIFFFAGIPTDTTFWQRVGIELGRFKTTFSAITSIGKSQYFSYLTISQLL